MNAIHALSKPLSVSKNPYRVFLATSLAAFCLLSSGCDTLDDVLPGGKPSEQIASPPDIPAPPASIGDETDPNSPQARLIYQDIIELEQQLLKRNDEDAKADLERQQLIQSQGLALVHAVQEGIRQHIFTPLTYDKNRPQYFEPQVPVTYNDFYTWALGFGHVGLSAASTDGTAKNAEMAADGELPNEDATDSENMNMDTVSESDALSTLGIGLPLENTDGGQPLLPLDTVTRESLCMLYVRMLKQQDQVKLMPDTDVENAAPGKSKVYALSEFQDRQNISPWAARYVAVAYKDGLLKNVFGLRPTALVNGQGLQPQKPVTRGEAAMFLYQFFSTHSAVPKATQATPAAETGSR